MTQRWRLPPGMTGDPSLIRVSASDLGDQVRCPERVAAKVRPAVKPRVQRRGPDPRYETFPLGRLMDVLDAHEFEGVALSDALGGVIEDDTIHPGASMWIRHAAECYVASSAAGGDDPLEAVRDYWVARRPGEQPEPTWEMYGWGRRYQSVDGALREFRFLRMGEAGERRSKEQVAVAAYTTATGQPAPWPRPWAEPFQTREAAPVNHVRVIEVGLSQRLTRRTV